MDRQRGKQTETNRQRDQVNSFQSTLNTEAQDLDAIPLRFSSSLMELISGEWLGSWNSK